MIESQSAGHEADPVLVSKMIDNDAPNHRTRVPEHHQLPIELVLFPVERTNTYKYILNPEWIFFGASGFTG